MPVQPVPLHETGSLKATINRSVRKPTTLWLNRLVAIMNFHYFKISLFSALIILNLQACNQQESVDETKTIDNKIAAGVPVNDTVSKPTGDNDEAAINRAAQSIDEVDFMQHINTLASDEFEGRAPATAGGKKTVEYLENEFKKVGLDPLFTAEDGQRTYRQAVKLMELNVTNSPSLEFSHADGSKDELPYKENSIVFTSRAADSIEITDSELVFVGYGVVAPEFGWNDYEGIDMEGKTAVILVNDPGYRMPKGELFKGRAMTYYGRWTYKFEEAARQGAAGAIIVHEDGAAGYPWVVVSGSWSGPQYKLFTEDGNADAAAVEAWITKPAAQKLFAKNGLNYEEQVAKATQPGFKPVPMSSKASSALQLSSRQSASHNVGGMITGRERPGEAFIYTAHWDHLGIKPDNPGKDKIFNGAQDNATGTAALLEMAQAFKALNQAPERSVVFLAVTAEESGLLGSKQYAEDPAIAMSKTVAGINIDAMSTLGASDDVVVVGYGNSEMDNFLRAEVEKQGRKVIPEPTPEKGFFYRSDHFNLAKKGVPMLYAEAGETIRNKPVDYGKKETARYLAQRYHTARDEVHKEWDNGGILQDLNAQFRIGVKIADSAVWPQWSEGNEFKAIREASLNASAAR